MVGQGRQVIAKAIGPHVWHLRQTHRVTPSIRVRHGRGSDVVEVGVLLRPAGLPVLLQMLLRVLQVVRARGVSPPYRALLEVTLQDVASAEGILAEMALVGSLARVCGTLGLAIDWVLRKLTSQKMALEVLQVQVRFVTMRTLILALGVLCCGSRRFACGGRGPTGMGRQNSAPTLLADDVDWLGLLVGEHRRVRVHRRVLQSHARRGAHLVAGGVCGRGGQHGRLRIGGGHGQVRRGLRLEGSQRRVLKRRHRGTAIRGRGHRRVRRLGRVRVAVVAVQRVLAAALQRRQGRQLVLLAIVLLPVHRGVAGEAVLAEAVVVVHYTVVMGGPWLGEGEVLMGKARPSVVRDGTIRRASSGVTSVTVG